MRSRCHFALLALACLSPLAAAADFNMDVKIDGVELGAPVMGPKLSAGDLKGRVVLLEFWGINCAPCLASLPRTARVSDELSAFGLVVVGAHAQAGTPEQIKDKARSRGVNFAVVENARVKDGNDFNGIPHCMLFDHTGKCVFRGHPTNVEDPLRVAVGKALAADLSVSAKPVNSLLEQLKKGTPPAAVLAKAVALSKSPEKGTAEPAKHLVERMTELAVKQFDAAQSQRSQDPFAVLPRAVRLSADFKGTPTGTKATELLNELKKDKLVQSELKARPTLEAVKKYDAALREVLGEGDPKAEAFQKKNAAALKSLQAVVKSMKKSWPDAPATAEAVSIADHYGLSAEGKK